MNKPQTPLYLAAADWLLAAAVASLAVAIWVDAGAGRYDANRVSALRQASPQTVLVNLPSVEVVGRRDARLAAQVNDDGVRCAASKV